VLQPVRVKDKAVEAVQMFQHSQISVRNKEGKDSKPDLLVHLAVVKQQHQTNHSQDVVVMHQQTNPDQDNINRHPGLHPETVMNSAVLRQEEVEVDPFQVVEVDHHEEVVEDHHQVEARRVEEDHQEEDHHRRVEVVTVREVVADNSPSQKNKP
jgi:hypothetical protein